MNTGFFLQSYIILQNALHCTVSRETWRRALAYTKGAKQRHHQKGVFGVEAFLHNFHFFSPKHATVRYSSLQLIVPCGCLPPPSGEAAQVTILSRPMACFFSFIGHLFSCPSGSKLQKPVSHFSLSLSTHPQQSCAGTHFSKINALSTLSTLSTLAAFFSFH